MASVSCGLFFLQRYSTKSDRRTWPYRKAPRRFKSGFKDPCPVPAFRYQRDPVATSGHRPACSDKGPSFRAGSARFAPKTPSALTTLPYIRQLTVSQASGRQVPSSGYDYRTAGKDNSHGSQTILIPKCREPYDKVPPVAGGLPSTCSPRRRRCSPCCRDRGRPSARRRRACNCFGDGRTPGTDVAADGHLLGPPGPTCWAACPGSLRSTGAPGRIVSPAITRASCPNGVDSGAAR
ncbi:hypothetical protein Taro_011894 [Colocasia esculenta]|uniref:Uncharacterized protein n=1 Tax=Colocasia esculenta TaxID=4460 RepID=A0A843U2K9_COLES|nr:hypothetical protein [Colocasia esculenta]